MKRGKEFRTTNHPSIRFLFPRDLNARPTSEDGFEPDVATCGCATLRLPARSGPLGRFHTLPVAGSVEWDI